MLFPQINALPQLSMTFDSNLSFGESRATPTKRHFLLSKKIKAAPKPLDNINETEETLPSLKSNDDFSNRNVFKELTQPNPLTKDFTQFNFGPRFDHHGIVIPHSIVGKVDSFMTQYQKQGSSQTKESKNLLNSKTVDKKPKNLVPPVDEMVSNPEKRNSLLKQGGPIKKPQKVKLTKMDLLADLNLSIERHNKADKDYLDTINKLETSDKLYLTKQTRILNLFKKYENKWKMQMEMNQSKIRRKDEDSVVKNAELYRPKQEAAEAFSLTQSDFEKYGDKVWYMTLRLYNVDPNDIKKILYINDLPDGFKKAIVEKRSTFIEKIRKPTEDYLNGSDLYKTFTSRDYLNQKFEKNQKTLSGIIAGSFKENFGNFQVFNIIMIPKKIFLKFC